MKINEFKNLEELSKNVAEQTRKEISKKPNLVLALPTGRTPILLYQELVNLYKDGVIDFKKTSIFQLDEYYNIGKNDKESFRYYLTKNFLKHINIRKENCYFLDGLTKNPLKTCQEHEEKIKQKGRLDLCILGIGKNGHIAFNEPGLDFHSRTKLVNLSEETQKINATCSKKALTIGIGTIMDSKKIFLLAGKEKNEILKKAIFGKITKDIPASILQKHSDTTIFMVK